MKFRNNEEEQQWKRAELWDHLGEDVYCDFGDIEAIDNDTYIDLTTNKKYTIVVKRKKFEITEIK